MMIFTEHPDHNRYISVLFDQKRRGLPNNMAISVSYLAENTGHGAMQKAIRLDNEVMHLLKAAPQLLAALKDCYESLSRLPRVDGAYRDTCMLQAKRAIDAAEKITY